MSRIAKNPYTLPEGVTAEVNGGVAKVKGSKGELSLKLVDEVAVKVEEGTVVVSPNSQSRFAKAMWATTWRLIQSMAIGVSTGYERVLEVKGVGYRANVQGSNLVLQLGYSHDVIMPIPAGIKVEVEKQTKITLTGIDKQALGQFASEIRSKRPPEPYKGKGVKYAEERIIRKEGKKK
jgi:large subunit ribosomal protein L6